MLTEKEESPTFKIKIYKIVNNIDERIYIGSTLQPLYKRWNDHKKRFRRPEKTQYSSSILFQEYGVENCKIILIDEYDVKNIEEQRKRERDVYDEFKNICVNKHLPYTSSDDIKVRNKIWRDANKDKLKLQRTNKNLKIYSIFKCDCGSIIQHGEKSRHLKTIKHQAFTTTTTSEGTPKSQNTEITF